MKFIRENSMLSKAAVAWEAGKPLTIEAVHADGSKDIIMANHTYNESQIEWYDEGSALNLIKKQNV